MNVVTKAVESGAISSTHGIPRNRFLMPPDTLSVSERLAATLDILEGIEEFRKSIPWWKRWTYCLGSAIADIRDLLVT